MPYQYVEINRHYYCLQQNLFTLAWFLLFKSRSLQFRPSFRRQNLVQKLTRLVLHQCRLRKIEHVLELPVYGNLILRVHRGYRIFNYQKDTTKKIIDPDVPLASVAREIEGVCTAGQLVFAPTVIRFNIKERWYEEELINGHVSYVLPKSNSAALLKMYHENIAPCIEQMILLTPPVETTIGAVLTKCVTVLEDYKLSTPELDVSKIQRIQKFGFSMIEQLWTEERRQIHLVFSHGDFSLRNMLCTKKGLVVLDWESVDRRSMLFDLYNCFFTELYYNRVSTNLVSEINQAVSSLQSRLRSQIPNTVTSVLPSAEAYRWLYYVERICMLLDRKLDNKLLDVILRSISVFSHYEKAVQGER